MHFVKPENSDISLTKIVTTLDSIQVLHNRIATVNVAVTVLL